ncbi:MAG: hypothetical protein KDJ81_15240 [Rhodobacteraceae bacterium]|nr:hypothetical protein [Paracoccaceae bacterium]
MPVLRLAGRDAGGDQVEFREGFRAGGEKDRRPLPADAVGAGVERPAVRELAAGDQGIGIAIGLERGRRGIRRLGRGVPVDGALVGEAMRQDGQRSLRAPAAGAAVLGLGRIEQGFGKRDRQAEIGVEAEAPVLVLDPGEQGDGERRRVQVARAILEFARGISGEGAVADAVPDLVRGRGEIPRRRQRRFEKPQVGARERGGVETGVERLPGRGRRGPDPGERAGRRRKQSMDLSHCRTPFPAPRLAPPLRSPKSYEEL